MPLILRKAIELFVTLIFRCDRAVYLNHDSVYNKQAEHILYICVCPLFYNKFSVFVLSIAFTFTTSISIYEMEYM